MQLLQEYTAPKAGETEAKRRAVSQTSGGLAQKDRQLLELTAKLCLSNDLHKRTLMGAMMKTIRITVESEYSTGHKDGVKEFMDARKAMRNDGISQDDIQEKIGVPDVFAFNGMVKVHMQQLEKKGDAANLDKIKKALEEWNPEGWKGVFD